MSRYSLSAVLLLAAGFASAAEKELHVVALSSPSFDPVSRSSAGAKVKVDRPGKEVILLVSGQNPIEWEITATPGTKLTKVIFGGSKRQSGKVPFGVDTEDMSIEGAKQRISPLSLNADYRIDSNWFRTFAQTCKKYTGLEIASFQGESQFDLAKPFVVDAIQKDERLDSDFPKVTPAAQVPKFQFDATRIAYGKEWRDARRTFGEFTQAGPAKGGFVQLTNGITKLTFDTKAKQHYGINTHLLYTVDLKLGTTNKIGTPADNFFPRAITYDAKRDRVIVTNGHSVYEYDTKNNKWTHLANGDGSSFYSAIVWQAKTDMLLAFGVDRSRRGDNTYVPTLYELNPNGAIALKHSLGSPLFPHILGQYALCDAELADLGSKVAMLVHRDEHDNNGQRTKTETFLYVLDPKSGKVQLAWKE